MSLHDEMAAALKHIGEVAYRDGATPDDDDLIDRQADAALAVVRRHIEAMPFARRETEMRDGRVVATDHVRRDAVLALLDEDAP